MNNNIQEEDKDDNGIPIGIHRKLVCIAKRKRFSHIITPRVWKPPKENRVLELLDDSSEPLTDEFYQTFIQFEKEMLEKESKKEQEVVVMVQKELSFNNSLPRIKEEEIKKKPNKKLKKDLLSWLRNTEEEEEEEEDNKNNTAPTISPPKRTSMDDSSQPQQHRSHIYTPAHCLIHQWNPYLRTRCYVYPTNQSTTTPQITTIINEQQKEIIYWIRLGCVRIEQNFALEQVLWMRDKFNCKISAIVFINDEMKLENSAMLTSLIEMKEKLKLLYKIDLIGFHFDENPSLFAIWTRSITSNIFGIFTNESYFNKAMKITIAVARSCPCPVFAFDSENIIPIRYLETKCGITKHDILNTFIQKVLVSSNFDYYQQKKQSDYSQYQFHKMELPEVVMKRWSKIIDWDDKIMNMTTMKQCWNETEGKKLIENIKNHLLVDSGLILAHIRLGTISSLDFINEKIQDNIFRTYLLYLSYNSLGYHPPTDQQQVNSKSVEEMEEFIKENNYMEKEMELNYEIKKNLFLKLDFLQTYLIGFSSPDVLIYL